MNNKKDNKFHEGFEPPSLDSKSNVITNYTNGTKKKERAGFEPTNPKEAILSRSHLTALLPLPTHNNPLPGIEPEATG